MAIDDILSRLIYGETVDQQLVGHLGENDLPRIEDGLNEFLPERHIERIITQIEQVITRPNPA